MERPDVALLLERVADLDYMLTNHYAVRDEDVPADIYRAHRVLVEERKRFEEELEKKKKN